MMKNLKQLRYFLLAILLVATACEKEDDEPIPGQPPAVSAGSDLTGTVGSTVALNGSANDPDGDQLTIKWEIVTAPSGSNTTISNASSATASFVPDVAGPYTLKITADDGNYDPVSDEVIVTVEESVGEPPVASIADQNGRAISAENENNTVTASTAYELDGSGSSDPDGDEITYLWEITSKPSNSQNATISQHEEAVATFTPDVVGEYTIQLTVTDANENSATQEVTLIADANPVEISTNINENTVWKNIFTDPNLPDYIVTNGINVYAQLTVMPGVKVAIQTDRYINITDTDAALIAKGKADSLIVFTAADSANGWRGLFFNSPNVLNELDYVHVAFGGSSEVGSGIPQAGIGLDYQDRVKITNSVISDSKGYGIYVEDGGVIETFANNTFSNNADSPIAIPLNQIGKLDDASTYGDGNADNSIEVFGSTIDAEEVQIIPATADGTPYHISGDLSIRSGLEINAGARFLFDPNTQLAVYDEGYLKAIGTAADSIIFTAYNIENGWKGIVIYSPDVRNELTYTRVSYGGTAEFGSGILSANIGIDYQDKLKITNSVISHSKGEFGLHMEDGGVLEAFANNTFRNNSNKPLGIPANQVGQLDAATTFMGNGDNRVEIYQSTLDRNNTSNWPAFTDGTPYYVSGNIQIRSGCVIEAGATFQFAPGTQMGIYDDAYLTADGTADKKITFTAANTTDGWQGLVFYSNLSTNKLNYVVVSYGGSAEFGSGILAANIGVDYQDKVAITNSEITNSKAYGIYVEDGGTVTDGSNVLTTEQALIDAGNTFNGNVADNVRLSE